MATGAHCFQEAMGAVHPLFALPSRDGDARIKALLVGAGGGNSGQIGHCADQIAQRAAIIKCYVIILICMK